MKNQFHTLIMAIAFGAMIAVPATMQAQDADYKFGDHMMSLSDISKEWHNQSLYSAGDIGGKKTIKNYFAGFAYAYPNDLFFDVIDYMLGLTKDNNRGAIIVDEKNGYIKGEIFTELTYKVEMCYWHCNNGNVLVGVALIGDEYRYEDNDWIDPIGVNEAPDDRTTVCVNDLMFYEIIDGEMIWRPLTPERMCGEKFDFKKYDIELPRQGKDIKLINRDKPRDNRTLEWNGNRFNVVK